MDIMFFLLLIFLLTGIIHLLIVTVFFSGDEIQPTSKSNVQEMKWPTLTILVCARNEAENLKNYIPLLCQQTYEDLQVVVVNHRSVDHTAVVLHEINAVYKNLQIVDCDIDDPVLPGKRTALIAGLDQAKGDLILLTDADCRPASEKWASMMVQRLVDSKRNIVLGIGVYENQRSWLNRFIQFETLHTAASYISAAYAGWPYMGVGRNMLIQKNLLESQMKKSVVPGIVSGDDDLFITHLSFTEEMAIESNSDAHTISTPSTNWSSFLRQKSRHISTASYYKHSHQFLLGLIHGSLAIFLASFIVLLFGQYLVLVLVIYLIRTVVIGFCYSRIRSKLSLHQNLLFFPAMEFLLIFIPVWSFFRNKVYRSNEWK
jgi:glycosyltransferase involved in cell wall biosynthesis